MTRICVSWEETKKRLKEYRDNPKNYRDLRTYAHALILLMNKIDRIDRNLKKLSRKIERLT